MQSPCYDCPDRHENCHAKCDKYHAFKAEREAINEKRSAQNGIADGVRDHYTRLHKYYRQRRNGR